MTRTFGSIAVALLLAWPLDAKPCAPSRVEVISAEARCDDSGGIGIQTNEEDGIKVACMQDRLVQRRCGGQGELTRIKAYGVFYKKLKQFETECIAVGGTFSFDDPNVQEPENESWCLPAQPELGSGMFEEPLCNYRSICPSVTVRCDNPCRGSAVGRLDKADGAHVTLRVPPPPDDSPLF